MCEKTVYILVILVAHREDSLYKYTIHFGSQIEKCLNVRQKLGTWQTCSLDHLQTCTLSFTHSGHAEQLLFSCLCSKLTLTLSHSHSLTLSHSTPAPSRILECVLMCVFTLPACEKNFEHSLQANGFSPEWVLMCNFKPLASVKHFEHCL